MNTPEIEAFLTHLAVERNVSPSTQNQALSALLFLYRHVLHVELTGPIDAVRAKKEKHLPTVLTKEEVHQVINGLSGLHQLMAQLLYGSGMRLMECLRLRVKDIEFTHHQIMVRDTKGNEDRVTMLSQKVVAPLQEHLVEVKKAHELALANGYGTVEMRFVVCVEGAMRDPHSSSIITWFCLFFKTLFGFLAVIVGEIRRYEPVKIVETWLVLNR